MFGDAAGAIGIVIHGTVADTVVHGFMGENVPIVDC
jgi:hypothetical protein